MRKYISILFTLVALVAILPVSASAADTSFSLAFQSYDDKDGTFTYSVEAKSTNEQFAEVIRGVPTRSGLEDSPFQLDWRGNAAFGTYTVRIKIVGPGLESQWSEEATVILAPGKPNIIRFQSTRSAAPSAVVR